MHPMITDLLNRRCRDWKQSIGRSHPDLLSDFFTEKNFQAGPAAMAELLPVIKHLHGRLFPRSNQHAFWDLPYDNNAAERYHMTLKPEIHLRGILLYRILWKQLEANGEAANNHKILRTAFGLVGGGQTRAYDKDHPLLLDRCGLGEEKIIAATAECRMYVPAARKDIRPVLREEVASLTEDERMWYGRRWFWNDEGVLPELKYESVDALPHRLLANL